VKNNSKDLARDLAKLFVKYDFDAWLPIISALTAGEEQRTAIVSAIQQLTAQRPASRASPTKRDDRLGQLIAAVEQTHPNKAEVLKQLRGHIRNRSTKAFIVNAGMFLSKVGAKTAIAKKADDAILSVFKALSELSEEQLLQAVTALVKSQRDLKTEYGKWFDIIAKS
jgi:hypothetical protein